MTTLPSSPAPSLSRSPALLAALLMVGLLAQVLTGCAAAPRPLRAEMRAMPVQRQQPRQQQVLRQNHFKSDRTGNLTEAQLKKILESPVFLEEDTRIGIVPVATAYEVDRDLPLATVPHTLSDALEKTGFFEVTTEVSTDWPKDRSVAGLRELAARYRAKYLMLYRHRFVHRERTNAWGWAYLTVVGALFVPSKDVEVAGVLEATLFDARTGTILFTVYERVHTERAMNLWNHEAKRREIKAQLLKRASDQLADKVTHKVRRLVAARPAPKTPETPAPQPVKATAQVQAPAPTPTPAAPQPPADKAPTATP